MFINTDEALYMINYKEKVLIQIQIKYLRYIVERFIKEKLIPFR